MNKWDKFWSERLTCVIVSSISPLLLFGSGVTLAGVQLPLSIYIGLIVAAILSLAVIVICFVSILTKVYVLENEKISLEREIYRLNTHIDRNRTRGNLYQNASPDVWVDDDDIDGDGVGGDSLRRTGIIQ